MIELRAPRVVLATGATELLLPFPGWTLPGVFGVGGLQALAKSGLDVSGKRVAVAGSGPLLLAVAASLRARGAVISSIHEQAPLGRVRAFGARLARHPRKLTQALDLLRQLHGVPRLHRSWPLAAEGDEQVEAVRFHTSRGERREAVDFLACAFGLVPRVELAALLGATLNGERVQVGDDQDTSVPGVYCAGESTGIGGVDLALAEGEVAGRASAGDAAGAARARPAALRERRFADALEHTYALDPALRDLARDDTLVCRCEDVPWSAVRARADARQAKLETRCGMGPCQGRVCGAALTFLQGWSRDRVRPPLVPVPVHALADVPPARAPQSPLFQEISP